MELLIARNPDPESSLPYLLRVPIGDGLVFRTKDTWPRTGALYCHPGPGGGVAGRTRDRRAGPAAVLRPPGGGHRRRRRPGREQRSQIVFTNARGREMVFWQSPRTRKQARPDVRLPTARAAGIAELEIVVDAHERYAYHFAGQQVRTVRRGLPCGDYAVAAGGQAGGRRRAQVAAPTWSSSLTQRPPAVRPRRAGRPAPRRGGGRGPLLADLQPRTGSGRRWSPTAWPSCRCAGPTIPIVFCETRKLAEEWTYRYLAAAHAWAEAERRGPAPASAPATTPRTAAGHRRSREPSTAEVRAWARANGLPVPDRGRLRPEIHQAWRDAAGAGGAETAT